MKFCGEYLRGLHHKLRMHGIIVEHLSCVFGDDQSVLRNSSKTNSLLKKKSSSVACHFVREEVAKNEWRTTYIKTHLNLSDVCAKSLTSDEKRNRFASCFLHCLC